MRKRMYRDRLLPGANPVQGQLFGENPKVEIRKFVHGGCILDGRNVAKFLDV